MKELALRTNDKIVAILPGSRQSELSKLMPVLTKLLHKVGPDYPNYTFVIAAANEAIFHKLSLLDLPPQVKISRYPAAYTLVNARAAIACSGTVTLECAFFGVPTFIVYKTSWTTFQIAKRLVKIPYAGMINILAQKFIAREFIQKDCTVSNLEAELKRILNDGSFRKAQRGEFVQIRKRLGKPNSSANAARLLKSGLH